MAKEKEYFFVPLEKKKKIETDDSIFVKINKQGVMNIGKTSLLNMGVDIEKGAWIHLYHDLPNRALGFKFTDSHNITEKKGSHIRFVKPNIDKETGVVNTNVSVKTFINALSDVGLPTPRLFAKYYTDNDSLLSIQRELYMVVVPKNKDKSNAQ